jgi:hypothetical protein
LHHSRALHPKSKLVRSHLRKSPASSAGLYFC